VAVEEREDACASVPRRGLVEGIRAAGKAAEDSTVSKKSAG
jgi:hypothetical protein